MTDTETRQAATVHGEVEYEVVECDSCGTEILADEANDFTIGDRVGVACDLCVEKGPSGFPMSDGESLFTIWRIALWPLLAPTILKELANHKHVLPQKQCARYLEGSLGSIVYMTILSLIIGASLRMASNAGGAIPMVVLLS
jgi:hypothetical protein